MSVAGGTVAPRPARAGTATGKETKREMSILPDMGMPNTMTEAEYAALPEEESRRIEVVHGYVIVCESPTPQHQRVARRLANALEVAPPKEPCTRGEADTDVVLVDV